MKKISPVYFVGFITETGFDEFVAKWEFYAKQVSTSHYSVLLQQEIETKTRFKYISHHKLRNDTISFSFMKGRSSEHFADQKVKVVSLGGYTIAQAANTHGDDNDSRLIAFISHQDHDIDFYRRLLPPGRTSIYEAYYENCAYGYIVEFFPAEKDSAGLLQQLNARTEACTYKECLVPHI